MTSLYSFAPWKRTIVLLFVVACCLACWFWELPWNLLVSRVVGDPDIHGYPERVDWSNPALALLDVNESIKELRWYKGKLFNPVGRFFGAHHSVLVAVGQSGASARIEKLGLGKVEFCPIKQNLICNLQPGELYKSAGGRFLKRITWSELHGFMTTDLFHYDVVDANCHHIVQFAWNRAVIAEVQDMSPAPDDDVASQWERFLRWLHGTAGNAGEESAESAPHRNLDWAPSETTTEANTGTTTTGTSKETTETTKATDTTTTPFTTTAFSADNEATHRRRSSTSTSSPVRNTASTTLDNESVYELDANNVRRRRRRRDERQAERCRGSKVNQPGQDGHPQCPQRENSHSDESSCSGGEFGKLMSESSFVSGHKRSYISCMIWPKFSDKDSCGSDCKFSEGFPSSACKDHDFSGSTHKRCASQEGILPMDPARVRPCSKSSEDSGFECEVSHTQHGRSKDDNANMCNSSLEGAQVKHGTDFLCQWTCKAGNTTFRSESTLTFKCQTEVDIKLGAGSTEDDCLKSCVSKGCQSECVASCRYFASEALQAGHAMCMLKGEPTSYQKEIAKTDMSGGEIAAIIGLSILYTIVYCCGFAGFAIAGEG